jgi:hypothetical protein
MASPEAALVREEPMTNPTTPARVDLDELEALLRSLDAAMLADNGVVIRRAALAALLAEVRASREREASGGWKPFYFDDATPVREGQACLFGIQGKDGFAAFVDSIIWDAETPADWNDGGHGWDIDDVTHFMPLPSPPAVKEPA